MNAPSRTMPPADARKPGVVGWIVFGLIVVLLGYGVVAAGGPVRWCMAGGVSLVAGLSFLEHRRRTRLRKERQGESICSFARALPAKAHDTWVVRAVYEEMSRLVRTPLRPLDDIKKIWLMHPDDLDDVASRIAQRSRRSMENTKTNPMFDQVVTIADMIAFFELQPKLPLSHPLSAAPPRQR